MYAFANRAKLISGVLTFALVQSQENAWNITPCLTADVFMSICLGSLIDRTDHSSNTISVRSYMAFLNQLYNVTSSHKHENSSPPPHDFSALDIKFQLPFIKNYCDYRSASANTTGDCYEDMKQSGQSDQSIGFELEDWDVERFLDSICQSIYKPSGDHHWINHCHNETKSASRVGNSNHQEESPHPEFIAVGVILSILITCAIGWFFIRKRRIPSAWNSKDVEINLHDSGSEYDGREVKHRGMYVY